MAHIILLRPSEGPAQSTFFHQIWKQHLVIWKRYHLDRWDRLSHDSKTCQTGKSCSISSPSTQRRSQRKPHNKIMKRIISRIGCGILSKFLWLLLFIPQSGCVFWTKGEMKWLSLEWDVAFWSAMLRFCIFCLQLCRRRCAPTLHVQYINSIHDPKPRLFFTQSDEPDDDAEKGSIIRHRWWFTPQIPTSL